MKSHLTNWEIIEEKNNLCYYLLSEIFQERNKDHNQTVDNILEFVDLHLLTMYKYKYKL